MSPTVTGGRAVLRFALVGTILLALAVLVDLERLGGHPLGLVQPGEDGPAIGLFEADFPDVEVPGGLGLDGQMTYAVARDPWPVDASADHLDRPRYRLQRSLLSWVAGTVHPGSGIGLGWTLFGLGLAGGAAGAVGVGRLSERWGGPPWVAALFPILPGCFMSVRVTTADAVGVGLALLAVALAARGRMGPAVAVGVAAVLAKEPTFLILAGWALAHRTQRDVAVAAVPAAVAGTWMMALRVLLPGEEGLNGDIGLPVVGLVRAALDIWSEGRELWGLVGTVGPLLLGAAALSRRRLRHPLGWALALNVAFVSLAGPNPLGTSFGGTRTGLATMALALVILATPHARRGREDAGDSAPTDSATSTQADRAIPVTTPG